MAILFLYHCFQLLDLDIMTDINAILLKIVINFVGHSRYDSY